MRYLLNIIWILSVLLMYAFMQYSLRLLFVALGVGASAFVGKYDSLWVLNYIMFYLLMETSIFQKDFVGQELQRDRHLVSGANT